MTQEELIGLIKTVPEKTVTYLLLIGFDDKAFTDWLTVEGNKERKTYLEDQLAKVPDWQAELDAMRP